MNVQLFFVCFVLQHCSLSGKVLLLDPFHLTWLKEIHRGDEQRVVKKDINLRCGVIKKSFMK